MEAKVSAPDVDTEVAVAGRPVVLAKNDVKAIEKARELFPYISSRNAALVAAFDVNAAITLMDAVPSSAIYHDLPPALTGLWKAVEQAFGIKGLEAFQKLTMLRLIATFRDRSRGQRYTPEIIDCFMRSFGRIIRSIEDPVFERYRSINDILLKDLALCRQQMFPAGARLVQPDSGVTRSLAWRDGLGQGLRLIALLLRCGGHRPWYSLHVHLSELDEFTPDGWDTCLLRLADMLALNPEVKGIVGGSWFYDPALSSISPHLAYIHERPAKNGASFFFSQIDNSGSAISRSRTRRRLYEQGRYIPQAYAMVWPRRSLISWAQRTRLGQVASKHRENGL